MKPYSLRLLPVLLVLALTACGFHLQGSTPMPAALKTIYIDSEDAQTDFQRGLRQALTTAGSSLAKDRAGASATLRITKDESDRRVLSVSARNTPREYEIAYTVTFAVSGDGRELLPPQTLTLTRDYSFDELTVLAKEREEQILREALARDLVGIVMRRLASL